MTWGDVWKLLVLVVGGFFLLGVMIWALAKITVADLNRQMKQQDKEKRAS